MEQHLQTALTTLTQMEIAGARLKQIQVPLNTTKVMVFGDSVIRMFCAQLLTQKVNII